jgi:cytochrome c
MDPMSLVPVPRDIPLPLPADRVLLEGVIVLLFLVHIVFVNLMVGGSVLGLAAEVGGLWRRELDTLAHEIARTITVNKSLAVVLGVGPLLAINVLYTIYFYSANALTGGVWILIVPVVSAAFLLAYAHKYSWERLAHAKRLHIALGAGATGLFLLVPLIFLSNINLMLFPDRWTEVRGFVSSLVLPNVLPRYLHFVLACVAVAALFLLGYFTRAGYPFESRFQTLDRRTLRRGLYGVTFGATLLQLLAGPLVFFTLPASGMNWALIVVVLLGVTVAIGALGFLWWEISLSGERVGRFYVPIVTLIMVTACFMGYGRHLYRETALRDHRLQMAQKTTEFGWLARAAESRALAGVQAGADAGVPLGLRVFRNVCGSCHAVDRVLVGPPLTEIARIYQENPGGIVAWTKAPGKKRPGFPPMPALRLPEANLNAVAEYMLQAGSREASAGTAQSRPVR